MNKKTDNDFKEFMRKVLGFEDNVDALEKMTAGEIYIFAEPSRVATREAMLTRLRNDRQSQERD